MSKVFKAASNAVSSVVKGVGSVLSGVVNAVGSVVSSVVNFVMSPFLGLFGGMPDMGSTTQDIQGVTVQRTGTSVNIPVVYGYRQVGGAVTFAETGSDNNKYFWVAYVFSEGPVEGLHDLFIDDVQIPAANIAQLNTGAMTTVTDTSCKYANALSLQWFCGVYDENPADTNVGNAAANGIFKGAPSWTRDMHYNGMATLFCRYEWKTKSDANGAQSAIYGGSIPVVKANILGRRVTSLVSGNPENIEYHATGYTERYSTNPAEILLDYLRNPWYGKGLSNSRIDFDSFKRAAAKCNTEVTYTTGGIKGPILTMNYVLATDKSIFANIKDMLPNFRGYLPYLNGKLALIIEDAGHPTDILSGSTPIAATFTKDNIQGEITYTGIDQNSKYNQVTVNYCDPDQQWTAQTVVYPATEAERNAYLTLDGYKVNKGDFTLAGITNYAIATDMARLIFNKSRQQDTLSLTVSSQAFELQPGDSIYVQSNIMKFGTDAGLGAIPWRIISSKLNNDYTFNLGCVRNESSIYPYVRTTDKAYNLAVYVPTGATRYYPPEPLGVPIGLHPPGYASLPTGESVVTGGVGTDYPVTVTPTDPTASAGGGVGNSTSDANSSSNSNTAPTAAVVVPPIAETISVGTVSYTTENGQIFATIKFTQPTNAAYTSTTIYYKRNVASETTWNTVTETTKPGAGIAFTTRIGPLLSGQTYMMKTRTNYGTTSSTKVGYEYLVAAASGTETPVNWSESIATGWALNTVAATNAGDASIASLSITPVLTAGHPSTPRSLQFTINQDINTRGQNTFVNGVQVLYRSSANTYWKVSNQSVPSTYVAGITPLVFTIADFGAASYPNPPTAQSYDIIIRYTYTDNMASVYQYRIMGAPVETNSIGGYTFDVTRQVIGGGNETVGSYTAITVDQAPASSVTNPLAVTIGLTSVETYNQGTGNVRLFFNPPNVANQPDWLGVRVYYRQVIGGSNPAYSTQDFTPALLSGTQWSVKVTNITYDTVYQWVVVPLVNSSGIKEATNCWSGQGAVHARLTSADYPANNNFITALNMMTDTTVNALSSLSTTFPASNPVASVIGWKMVYNASNIAHYYQLQVQVPTTNFNELRIYRRTNARLNNSNYTYAWGTGQWELITVTSGFNSDGLQTFNLRAPINYTEFDMYYNITSASPYYAYKSNTLLNGQYATNKPLNAGTTTSTVDEFLLVLKTNGAVSTVGVLLPMIAYEALVTSTNGLLKNIPVQVNVADYNTYTAGYARNLTDARASTATNRLAVGGGTANVTLPVTTPTMI